MNEVIPVNLFSKQVKRKKMIQTAPFEQYTQEYEAWFDKYQAVYESELIAIKDQMLKLPQNIRGVEIGVGSGRFAGPLGIKDGVEPAEEMRLLAAKRGIEVMDAKGERLPYADLQFDFALFVTVCHLENPLAAFKESHRILKPGGSIIVGFIDKELPIGQEYQERRSTSRFYRRANFYTVDRVSKMLNDAGFRNLDFIQTLFGGLDEIKDVESPKPGYGEGSFVVVKADKKK